MILAGMQIPRLAAPFELACHTGGQRYTGFQFTVIERQSHGNFAPGMRDFWQANKAAREAQAAKRDAEWRGNPGETVASAQDRGLFHFAILNWQAACHALSRADLGFTELQ